MMRVVGGAVTLWWLTARTVLRFGRLCIVACLLAAGITGIALTLASCVGLGQAGQSMQSASALALLDLPAPPDITALNDETDIVVLRSPEAGLWLCFPAAPNLFRPTGAQHMMLGAARYWCVSGEFAPEAVYDVETH